jgi:hypothetical protein
MIGFIQKTVRVHPRDVAWVTYAILTTSSRASGLVAAPIVRGDNGQEGWIPARYIKP